MIGADRAARYRADESINGSWRVLDRETGRPVEIDGIMQLGMELGEAKRLAAKLALGELRPRDRAVRHRPDRDRGAVARDTAT